MLALARKIVAGEEDAGSVESVFAQAQQVAAEAEVLLVDEGWHAPEPEPVPATVAAAEPVPDDEAGEPQRPLFSWAEFMAEKPDEPANARRRNEAPTLSLRVGPGAGAGGGAGRLGGTGTGVSPVTAVSPCPCPCVGPFVVSADSSPAPACSTTGQLRL